MRKRVKDDLVERYQVARRRAYLAKRISEQAMDYFSGDLSRNSKTPLSQMLIYILGLTESWVSQITSEDVASVFNCILGIGPLALIDILRAEGYRSSIPNHPTTEEKRFFLIKRRISRFVQFLDVMKGHIQVL